MDAIYAWWMSGEFKPTFDGLATIFAALVAILAAWIAYMAIMKQIQAERENLHSQLDTEKQARETERQSRTRSLATALPFEIDNFYMRELMDRGTTYDNWEKSKGQPAVKKVFVSVVGKPFAVFEASAGMIGDLDSKIARSVMVCYGSLTAYAELIQKYAEAVACGWPGLLLLARPNLQNAIKTSAEQAVQLAQVTCRNLTRIAEVDCSELMVARDKLASQDAQTN